MTTNGKTLMQIESEKRKKFRRVLLMIGGLPVLAVGVSLLYFGYSETDLLYLFLYFALGLTVTLLGFILIISGLPAGGKKIVVSKSGEFEAPASKCPHCGASIVSAGKFCGNCGKMLDSAPSE